MNQYSIVTVSHAVDYPLLAMQARSIGRYVSTGLVKEFVVVENWGAGPVLNWRRDIRNLAGIPVRFIDGRDIAAMPAGASGWWTQQVLKLAVAGHLATERYLILDAKNHFIAPLRRSFIESAGGKPRMCRYRYADDHPLLPRLRGVLRFFGQPESIAAGEFPTTSPPFIAESCKVLGLRDDLQRRAGKPFAQAMIDNQLTEFFAYCAFILTTGRSLESVYEFGQPHIGMVWPHQAGQAQRIIADTDRGGAPLFGVHRGALPKLTQDDTESLAALWLERGLFNSFDEGMSYISDALPV